MGWTDQEESEGNNWSGRDDRVRFWGVDVRSGIVTL